MILDTNEKDRKNLSTIIITAYLPMRAIVNDASFKEQVYIQSVGINDYHFDDSYPLTYWGNYHFLLNQTRKKSMDQGNSSELRPCPACAVSEYAAFYQNAADRYSPEEIARFKKLDEVNWLRSEGNLVPLEDLAELYPWMYTWRFDLALDLLRHARFS